MGTPGRAINSEDHLINLPVLGVRERGMRRMKQVETVLTP